MENLPRGNKRRMAGETLMIGSRLRRSPISRVSLLKRSFIFLKAGSFDSVDEVVRLDSDEEGT